MLLKIKIPFETELDGDYTEARGDWGVILAPADKLTMDEGILPQLSKKLRSKDISTVRFNFPFQMNKTNRIDTKQILDEAYQAVWKFVSVKYPDKKWCVGGLGIGGLTALRVSTISYADFGIPPVICLSYPMYPANKPELVDTSALSALMGDGLFCQGNKSNRGTYDRLKNQANMMARHARISLIRGANHYMEVDKKEPHTVAYWIAADIGRFLNELNY
ncbi:MAG: alpha/beta family hydrolase [Candidatus Heimdallarchaeota archaeon]